MCWYYCLLHLCTMWDSKILCLIAEAGYFSKHLSDLNRFCELKQLCTTRKNKVLYSHLAHNAENNALLNSRNTMCLVSIGSLVSRY